MDDTSPAPTTGSRAPEPAISPPPRAPRKDRTRLLLIGAGLVTLLLVAALGGVAMFREDADPEGLLFVIPKGAAATLEQPTIDSAIAVPTDIRFGPGEEARITIRNDDETANRAGPWVVAPGQTYTIGPLSPGTYQFDCTVDPAETVIVTVEGR